MSSFFTVPAAQRKRKRIDVVENPKKRIAAAQKFSKPQKPPTRRPKRDESISGSESEDDDGPRPILDQEENEALTSGSEDEGETAAERRLRLAERYLENIREEVQEVGFDAEDIDRDLIAERLQEDVAESKGKIYRKLAVELSFDQASHANFRMDTEAVTSIATCAPYTYTVSKDMWLIKWRIQDIPELQWPNKGKKRKKAPPPPKRRPEKVGSVRGNCREKKNNSYQGHVDAILAVAASQDGKFVVTGGRDRRMIVWDAETLKPLRVFSQHRDAVTALAFRRGTNQLYSASKDRTIKVWSLNELAYVETLFGHQDEIVDIDALAQERCLSVGARDRTARLWRVVEETQLVFRGGGGGEKKSRTSKPGLPKVLEGSIDRVAMIDDDMFVTGGDNGSLSLWVTHKKKAIFTYPLAHGVDRALLPEEFSADVNPNPENTPAPQPRWITALATVPFSDVIISGGWDGQVRAWKVSEDKKRIEALGIVGSTTLQESKAASTANGNTESNSLVEQNGTNVEGRPLARGVVNDISVFERGDRGKDGLCVVVALGREHRLGRWVRPHGGKNGAVVFEVPRVLKVNGVNGIEKDHPEVMGLD